MPLCGVCDFRKITKPAIFWCSECDEKFCTDCSDHHSSAKSSRHHTTTPIDVYQKLPTHLLETEQFCREHDDRFTLFCKNHDSPCCRTCSFEKHKQCPDIAKIEDVVQNVKLSNVFQETEQSLNDLAANINKIQNDRKNNLESVESRKMYVEKEIQEFRVKLNGHLDKLQDDIIKKLYKAKETEKKAIQKIVDDLHQKEKDVKENQVSLSNVKQYASDLQAYLAMKKIQDDIGKIEDVIESLIDSNKLHQRAISFKINPAFEEILSQKTFGDIIVEQRGCNVEIVKKKKNQQAQLLVPHTIRSIDDIKLQLQQTLTVKSSDIRGCCALPDGRLVFTDTYNNKLILMNADGTHNTTITTPSCAFDVTYVKYNNSVAVTSVGNKCITFIDIKTNKVIETVSLQTDSFGIVEKNNVLYYCTYDSINSLNLTDKTITKIIDTEPGYSTYIEIHENKLYHTNYKKETITCHDFSGEVKWQYKDGSIDPMGITVDNGGNVYVANDKTSNVVVISPDGQKCREILSAKDKLSGPYAIHFDRSTGNLIVANRKDQKTFLYKVT